MTSNIYALLVGIDYYGANNLFKNLRGCARDIDLVAGYLQNCLKVPESNIWKLTSPFEENSSLSKIRLARKEVKPTYENIVNAFNEITAIAKKAEQVYIHYSAKRLLMKKVGGGYMFYHRMLLEHFAGIKQADVTQNPVPVVNNLTCKNCGQENSVANNFCIKCGMRL
ncbi:MAG: hypothetical protein AAFX46_15285 [Cyanobacteria bacterium J06636_27]